MGVRTYADFSGGWYGTLDPAKVPDNMFDATNMIVYRDGAIGPRPGMRRFNMGRILAGSVYGIDTRRNVAQPSETGVLYLEESGTDGDLWGVVDDNNISNVATFADNLVAGIPAAGFPANIWHKTNFRTLIHVPGAGLWRWQQGVLTALDVTSGSRVGTSYGVRLLRDEDGTLNLFYSNASDPATWDPLNFISFGEDPGASIVNISELNNYCILVTDYGAWFMLSGTPGINDVVRQVYQDLVSPAPWGMKAFVTTADAELFGLSPDNNYPVKFNGTKLEKLQYLTMTPEDPQASYASDIDLAHVRVVAFVGEDANEPAFIMPDSVNRMLLRQNGVWGYHEIEIPVGYAWTSNGGRLYGVSAEAYDPSFAVQKVTKGGAGLTSFTLTFSGQTTGAIDDMATDTDVQTALEALSNIAPGDVAVTGVAGGPWTVYFIGTLADTVATLTSTPTGGTGTITITVMPTGAVGLTTDLTLNRPAFTSDTHAQPGDDSDTPVIASFTLPEHWTDKSDPVTVSEVVIDFVHFDTGTTEDNNITVTVTALARGNESGTLNQSQVQTWTMPTSESTTAGVENRVRFPFQAQGSGAGYRVELTAIRGVKIREIVVHDSEDANTWRAA